MRHHYDLSNEFYGLFLDEDMNYSCAYYEHPEMTLEQAQLAKKRHNRRADVVTMCKTNNDLAEKGLQVNLVEQVDGKYKAKLLSESNKQLDHLWDNYFSY